MVAVIIIGILMVFTLSLVLVTYTLYASQNKKAASKRNAEAANSLSTAIAKEIEGENADATELWRYIRFNICQENAWPYYDPYYTGPGHGEKEAFRYFDMKVNYSDTYFTQDSSTNAEDKLNSMDGFPGSVKLCVYWMLPEDSSEFSVPTTPHTNEVAVSSLRTSKAGIRLYVEVICETASQTYVVKNRFSLGLSPITDEKEQKLVVKLAGVNTYNPVRFQTGTGTDSPINVTEKWIWSYDGRE